MLRKLIIALIIIELIFSQTAVAFANPGSLAADFLYEIALKYYRLGNLEQALHEANKILLVDSVNEEAVRLIEQIKKEQAEQKKSVMMISKPEEQAGASGQAMLTTQDESEKELLIKEMVEEQENRPIIVKKPPVRKEELIIPAVSEQEKKIIIVKKPPVRKEELIIPAVSEQEKKIVEQEKGIVEEEREPVIIAMERVLPKPKGPVASEWVIRPEERVTSKDLEDYRLFSEAKLFINGNQVEIDPIIIKNSDIRLTLEKIARAFGLVVFSPEKDALTVIGPEGLPLQFRVGKREVLLNNQEFKLLEYPVLKYEGWTMITLQDLGKALGLETNWDKDNKIITINSQSSSKGLVTFTRAKPKEVKPEEVKALPEEKPSLSGRLTPMPLKFQPDIRLRVNNYVVSSYNNLTKQNLQTEQLRITGDIYDYKFDSEFKWKETEDRHFLNDGKYFGLFKEDLWLKFLNLSANIPHLRSQAEGYEGVEITKFYNPFSTKVYTGERDITVTGPTEIGAVRYYGHLLGFEQSYASDNVGITQALISTEAQAETERKSGTTAFPRRNLISITDTTLKFSPQLGLSGQYAFCNYSPDNEKDTLIQDNDYRLEAKMDGERLLWGYRYEFVGNEYASLGDPSIYQDYKGWDVYSRYKLTKRISTSAGYSSSQDNVDKIVTQPINKNKNLSLGADLSLFANTNLGFNWFRSESRAQDPTLGISSSTFYDYLLTLSQNWKDLFFVFDYDHYSLKDESGSFSDTGSFSLYKFLPNLRGSYLRVRQQIRRTGYKDSATPVTTDYNSSLGLRYYLLRNFYMYGDLGLENIRTEDAKNNDLVSLISGFQWDINNYAGFGLDFNLSPYDLSNKQNSNTRAWSLLFRFINRFDINSPPKWGKIKGRIFKDINGNGVYDNGEATFAGITMSVPDEFIAQSDRSGTYLLEQVTPGAKTVNIETKDLPIELMSAEGEARNVIVESGKTVKLDFPIIEASSIKGRVFIDENKNGVYDLGEEGLEGINIYLSPKLRTAKSDENGRFSFEFLSPGNYEVTMDPGQLPIEYKLALSKKLLVKLASGKEVPNADFRVILKPIVIKKF